MLSIIKLPFFLTLLFMGSPEAARILGVTFIPSHSHSTVFRPIFRELSLRGHRVVVVAPHPLKRPDLTNLTEIDVSYVNKRNVDLKSTLRFDSYTDFWTNTFDWMLLPAEDILKDPRVRNLCEDGEKFDLVLVEGLLPVFYALGTKCDAPTIGMISMDGMLSTHTIQGNPIHPILFGDMLMSTLEPLTLTEKLRQLYHFVWYKWYYNYKVIPKCDALVKKYLGQHLPSLEKIEDNSSMAFVNTNLVMNPIRPMSPTVVPMGFVHIGPPKPLPEDLQKVLDDAKQGAIYFSLGSNVKSSELPAEFRNVIVETFALLPYTILWKWETDDVPVDSTNVFVRRWFPQSDLLAHPNLKVFVTHAGLHSIEESIMRGVPMVAVPLFADQPMNAQKITNRGIAVQLDAKTLTVDKLKTAIIEVAENERYSNRVRELKRVVEDQPMTGLERAVWWAEYVARHKGARHLRSVAADVSLAEYLMVDVLAATLAVLVVSLAVSWKIVRLVTFRYYNSRRKTLKLS